MTAMTRWRMTCSALCAGSLGLALVLGSGFGSRACAADAGGAGGAQPGAAAGAPAGGAAGEKPGAGEAGEKPDASKLPHMSVDVKKKQVRVECEAVNANMPLEFFVCLTGTAEHEAVLRSAVKPSHLHLGLLMLGLKPGEPVRFSKAMDKWLPPSGPPLQISCEWAGKDNKTMSYPAYRMMRNVKTKKEMPAMTWIFAGSRMMEDGKYAADTTGYLVSVVNFDLTVIDIPELASSANETLEWEFNPDICPPRGTKVYLVIEPAGGKEAGAEKPKDGAGSGAGSGTGAATGGEATKAGAAAPGGEAAKPGPDSALSDVKVDEEKVKRLRSNWEKVVRPRAEDLRKAAQAHYEVLNQLRREQNRLIDEADRIQRVIDQLQREYQDFTTPHPEGAGEEKVPERGAP